MTIQTQIDDILQGIEELKKSEGSKFQIKAMERTRKSLQKQLDKLEKANQDDTLTFEQLGIDRLFIDEAHEFKNLFVATKLQNVAGISNSASQKALDLFLKCRYLDEKTGGKGVIFATGTPIITRYQRSETPILRCLSIPPYILTLWEDIRRYCFTAHFPLTIPQKPHIIVLTKKIQPEVQNNGRKDHNIYIRQKDLHSLRR